MKNLKEIMISVLIFNLLGCAGEEFSADKELFSQRLNQIVLKKKVDIIIVVDNSLSMIKDQRKLSREFGSFISAIEGADYRIGVITTDAKSPNKQNVPGFYGNLDTIGDNGELFISPESSDPAELFRLAVHREETQKCIDEGDFLNCVTPHETPIKALKLALDKRNSENRGFFRRDAELGVVIITDEDETIDPDDGSYTSPADFINYFNSEFSQTKLLQVFSISIPDGDVDCLETQKAETNTGAAVYGLAVSQLASVTDGFNANICSDNYGSDLIRISEYVESSLLITRIALLGEPVTSSISLIVKDRDGNVLDIDWKVNGNYLELFPTPPEGSEIDLSFRY